MNEDSIKIDRETLIFLHIAKTAGTTFNYLIGRNFFKRNSFGAYEGELDSKYRSGTGLFSADYVAECLHEAEAKRGKPFGFLPGHMRFGLHARLDRPSTYITFVRDPVERVASAFNYVKSLGWLEAETTLAQFVESDFLGNSNYMVRQLVGDPSLDTIEDPALRKHAREVTEVDYRKARGNIKKHFLFAAPISDFDKALFILSHHFGWDTEKLFYTPKNITPTSTPAKIISPKAREMILERNEWDAKLFEFAATEFKKSFARIRTENPNAIDAYLQQMQAYRRTIRSVPSDPLRAIVNAAFQRIAARF